MYSPEEPLPLPAEESAAKPEPAYLPRVLSMVDEVLARYSHTTTEVLTTSNRVAQSQGKWPTISRGIINEGALATARITEIEEIDALHRANVQYWREGTVHSPAATMKYQIRLDRLQALRAVESR